MVIDDNAINLTVAEVPIIALTANAISGTKEMFLAEGMNDFVAKPIEIRVLMSKVKQWLPVEKVKRVNSKETEPAQKQSNSVMPSLATLQIGDLKVQMARQLLGPDRLLWSVLKEYYRVIEKKSETITGMFEAGDWVIKFTQVCPGNAEVMRFPGLLLLFCNYSEPCKFSINM